MAQTSPSRPELRAALEALAAEPANLARRTAVLEQLLTGTLLATLAVARDGDRPPFLCFTDEEAFGRLQAPGPCGIVRLPELWAWLTELELPAATINAGGPVTVTLHAGELAALAEGRLPEPEERDVLFAPPAPVPAGLPATVAAAAERHPEVRAAYVLEAEPVDGARRLVAALVLVPALHESRAAPVVAAVAAELAAAGASAVGTTDWEAELIAAGDVEPVFARAPEPGSA